MPVEICEAPSLPIENHAIPPRSGPFQRCTGHCVRSLLLGIVARERVWFTHCCVQLHLLRFAWACGGSAHPSELPQGTADVWLQGKLLLGKAVAFQQGICVWGGAGGRLCCFFQFSVGRALRRGKSPALLRSAAGLHRGLFGCPLPPPCPPPAWKRQRCNASAGFCPP